VTDRSGVRRWSGRKPLASTIESNRRSSCAASLLANTTDVSTVNTATDGSRGGRRGEGDFGWRNDADRPKRGNRTSGLVAQDVPDPSEPVWITRGWPSRSSFAPQVADEHVGDVRIDVEVVIPHTSSSNRCRDKNDPQHSRRARRGRSNSRLVRSARSPSTNTKRLAVSMVSGPRRSSCPANDPRGSTCAVQRVQSGDQLAEVVTACQVVVSAPASSPANAIVDGVARGTTRRSGCRCQAPATRVTTATPSSSGIGRPEPARRATRSTAARSASLPFAATRTSNPECLKSTGHRRSDVRVVVDHQHRPTHTVKRRWLCQPHRVTEWLARALRRSGSSGPTNGWRMPGQVGLHAWVVVQVRGPLSTEPRHAEDLRGW